MASKDLPSHYGRFTNRDSNLLEPVLLGIREAEELAGWAGLEANKPECLRVLDQTERAATAAENEILAEGHAPAPTWPGMLPTQRIALLRGRLVALEDRAGTRGAQEEMMKSQSVQYQRAMYEPGAEVHDRALDYLRANPGMSYDQAKNHVQYGRR